MCLHSREVDATAEGAPGTALLQHWLSDVGDGGGDDDWWDPLRDFPTREVLRRYPDIGDGDDALDFYTLWYTTTVVHNPPAMAAAAAAEEEDKDEDDGRPRNETTVGRRGWGHGGY